MSAEELEYQIKSVDVVLSILRTQRADAERLEEKLDVMKCQRRIEGIRAGLRRQLFAARDSE